MSKRARRYLLVLAVLIAVSAFVGFQFFRDYQNLQALNAEKAARTAELDAKTQNNEELQAKLDDSSSDSFVERVARELLGWVRPGEIKIVEKGN